ARACAEDRLRLVIDAAPDAMIMVDAHGAMTLVNARTEQVFDYTRSELLGRPVEMLVPERFRAVHPGLRGGYFDRPQARPMGAGRELFGRRRDGSEMPVEIQLVPFRTDEGRFVLASVVDVTERKRAEAALRESEQRFRQIAENINEVFWMTDVQKNQMLYISPGYELIWGRTCASLCQTPRTWLDAIHPEDRGRVLEAAMAKQQRGDYDEVYRIIRPDDTVRWIRDRAFPIRNDVGQVFRVAGIAEDITDYRRLEEQFRKAQKMEAIGTLAGGIAHDFNNILAAITGFTSLARIAAAGNAEVQEYLEEIGRAGERAADLVQQIMAFSRQREHKRSPIQLRYAVAEALTLLRATIPATIEFRTDLPSDLPAVLADATQIHQVVMNLGTNAWHAMRDRPGRLEVRLEKLRVDEHLVEMHAGLHPGPYVRLSVSDTGHGMDQRTRERMFEPFFTTKAPGEGTGLGLSVVHGIVQGHDGVITVYSEVGKGTAFQLYFPAVAAEASAGTTIEATIPRGTGQRVLVVDDEEPLARLGKKMLEQLGYAAEVCTSAAEALAAVRADPDRFALIVTDDTMPMMTGTSLARQLLQLRPDLPIVLTSGYSARLTREQVLEAGIRDLLLKPTTLQLLGATVHRLLAQEDSSTCHTS
ncbi:MAG TPA: PAS domain S-box protein, partial [Planctomycetota bacterium]|nr:PAS domain S-box protein [Planctomycetota bacterium]